MILHIDDGSMGGGGPIPHADRLTQQIQNQLLNNNYGSGSNTGFDRAAREHIFHYAVFAHYNEDGDENAYGLGNNYGSFIRIYHEAVGTDSTDNAYNFMHELGHNLGLGHPSDNNDDDGNFWRWTIETCMYTGLHDNINYASSYSKSRDANGNTIPNNNEWEYVKNHMAQSLQNGVWV